MIQLLAKNWWAVELRGVFTVIFGLFVLFMPAITLGAFVLLFGIYALAEGVVLLVMSFNKQYAEHRWITLLQGLAGIAAGLVTFMWPGITAVALLVIIAAWALMTGILEIAGAIWLRKEITGEWLMILSGILSVVFAYILISQPVVGALALVWVIGAYAVVYGLLLMGLGIKVHKVLPRNAGLAAAESEQPGFERMEAQAYDSPGRSCPAGQHCRGRSFSGHSVSPLLRQTGSAAAVRKAILLFKKRAEKRRPWLTKAAKTGVCAFSSSAQRS